MRLEYPQKVPGNEFFPEWNESGTLRGIKSIPYPTFGLSDVANTGGSAGTRTQGHLIKSQMLYQLSYRPTEGLFIFQQWE